MATTAPTALPESFEVPFRIVQQETRHDCILAAIATLTGKSLEEVWTASYKLGLPKSGMYFVSEDMIAKLLIQLGGLVATGWKDFTSFDALDDVCLLWVDIDKRDPDNTGRTVVFHHVRSMPDKYSSFSYILDVAAAPGAHNVCDINKFAPTSYIAVKAIKAK